PQADLPRALGAGQIAQAFAGAEVASETYLHDLAPVMDVCVPSGKPRQAVCASLDLLELQRQVQHVRIGQSGYALAFDRNGRLLAAGAGALRASVLTGEAIAESPEAVKVAAGDAPARRFHRESGDVIAGWSPLPKLRWSIAAEQPVDEALSGTRGALLWLSLGALATLLLSLTLGYVQARRMLTELELEERWRTAGQIASGITHDLGHRLAILQQIKSLSEMNDPAYLPRIRESLASEVETLKRFVSDFADLTREAKPADFLPIELNAFAETVRRAADPYATASNVRVEVQGAAREVWVRGDRYMLERAALNLTRNAIEASSTGARVRLEVVAESGRALLRIEDQGAGIDAGRLPTLFDSFRSTKRTGAHVGMGLPNVRRIAVAHGGNVTVASRKGEGSTFTISLPASESALQAGASLST
ncbi:MAG TPA: ATP-binding protein, partial [Myxococcales bacterium]|nr:ATP-binding protein [Myxococcales bacterium]